jgi:hypothetical protein
MVPLGGVLGSAAGAALSQTAGSEAERTQREGAAQQRQITADQKAELAAGIGQTEQDQESSERDADGRRLWEKPTPSPDAKKEAEPVATIARQSKDATGQSGTQLDLTG